MLILAGKEFLFFTVDSMEVCSGFVLKIELVTRGFFIIAEQSLVFVSASHPTAPVRGAQDAERGQSQDS